MSRHGAPDSTRMLDHGILHHKYHSVDRSEISFLKSGHYQNRRMSQRKLDLDVALCCCTCARPVHVGLVAIASNFHQFQRRDDQSSGGAWNGSRRLREPRIELGKKIESASAKFASGSREKSGCHGLKLRIRRDVSCPQYIQGSNQRRSTVSCR